MVAVHKPSGLLVHRSLIDKRETQFAMQMVRDQIGQHVYTVHRLDRPTSGVLLMALSSEVARQLTEQFSERTVNKTYHAIVRGHTQPELTIDYALKEKLDKIADKHARQDKPAQPAITEMQCLTTFELPFAVGRYSSARYSLVKLCPHTGRKHQLRRHMAHISHPIMGDTTHGDGKHNAFLRAQFGYQGLALCCSKLQLLHPRKKTPLLIQTELDSRMQKLIAAWGMERSALRRLWSN